MTIKVCKEKTMKRLSSCGKVFSKLLQIFFFLLIPLGVYLAITDYSFDVAMLPLVFGLLLSFFFVPLLRSDGGNYETILHDVNNKLKLFRWNEDC